LSYGQAGNVDLMCSCLFGIRNREHFV
jgi:hypothetical protein